MHKIRYILLATITAFIINNLLPFFAVYNFPLQEHDNQTESQINYNDNIKPSFFGDKVLICTTEGFKWINWQDLVSGKEQPKPHPQYKCPLCYIALKSLKYLHNDQYLAINYKTELKEILLFSAFLENSKKTLLFYTKAPRAPPLSIIS